METNESGEMVNGETLSREVRLAVLRGLRCEHENTDTEPADPSVGAPGGTWCEDCGQELDPDEYGPDFDGDEGDRLADARRDHGW